MSKANFFRTPVHACSETQSREYHRKDEFHVEAGRAFGRILVREFQMRSASRRRQLQFECGVDERKTSNEFLQRIAWCCSSEQQIVRDFVRSKRKDADDVFRNQWIASGPFSCFP